MFLLSVLVFQVQCGHNVTEEPSCDFQFEPDLITYKDIDHHAEYSPDGSMIAFIRKDVVRQIWALETICVATREQTQVMCGFLASPSWSPDGSRIVLEIRSNLHILHLAVDTLSQLTFEQWNFNPKWSSDGQWISFVRYYNSPDSIQRNGLWIIRPDGTNARQLLTSQHSIQPSWFTTEQTLIFFENDSLFTYSLESETKSFLLRLDLPGSRPVVSSDGKQVYFLKHPDGFKPNLWKMNLTGEDETLLTQGGALGPSLSPDGKYVVYTEMTNTGRIWKVDAETGESVQLTKAQ